MIFNAVISALGQVIVGEMTLDEAYAADHAPTSTRGRRGEVAKQAGAGARAPPMRPATGAPAARAGWSWPALAGARAAQAARDPIGWVRRRSGISGIAGRFLAPNLIIFGLFIFLPIVINLLYSMTGGAALFLDERSFVGADQFRRC